MCDWLRNLFFCNYLQGLGKRSVISKAMSQIMNPVG